MLGRHCSGLVDELVHQQAARQCLRQHQYRQCQALEQASAS